MNWDQTIINAPYNTLNLPQANVQNLSNPSYTSIPGEYETTNTFETPNLYPNSPNSPNNPNSVNNPRQSHRVPLGTETKFYDPTKKMVSEYSKANNSMYDNRGKYFDQYMFNQKFDQYIKKTNEERLLKEKVQLYDLDRVSNIQIAPYQLPLDKLLINFKNVWFKLFDDIMNWSNPMDNFTTDNLFYYGIGLIVIFILYIMLSYIFD